MTTIVTAEEFSIRAQKVRQFAHNLFQSGPDWLTFFREVLGVSGAARKVFPTQEEFIAFEKTAEYTSIQNMVASLRQRKAGGGATHEPTRVITVRLPESLHEALKAEAADHSTSMNKLCISKLLQVLQEAEEAAKPTNAIQSRPLVTQNAVVQPTIAPALAVSPATTTPSHHTQPASTTPMNRPGHAPSQPGTSPLSSRFNNEQHRNF